MRDTIDMARETKMPYDFVTGEPINLEKLKAFEALVRADEREQALAEPVQEPVAYWIPKAEQFCMADPSGRPFAKAWEPLYTTPPAAQPAVPDAFGTREGEHPQYIQGWNDCRAEMLKGMKP
jgi:hypothetical protein